jgi:hypothetical protein
VTRKELMENPPFSESTVKGIQKDKKYFGRIKKTFWRQMLNKTVAVKALMLLLSASTVLVPIVYGLIVYGWNIQAMVMPLYNPPKIDFRMEPSGTRFEKGQDRPPLERVVHTLYHLLCRAHVHIRPIQC